jgi:5-methylcytosine-specific restriction endonuclease McrA
MPLVKTSTMRTWQVFKRYLMDPRVLVLNQSYMPLLSVHWTRAMVLIFSGKAEIIENSDHEIRTVNQTFKVPSIIRVFKWIKNKLFNTVRFSKNNVYLRDGSICQYCGRQVSKANGSIDHVIPKSRNGKTTFENCVWACKTCNVKKGSLTPDEAGMALKRQPFKPSKDQLLKHLPENWRTYFV